MTQREQKFLEIISRTLSVNSFLGDDCAFLPEFKLCITQDNLIEDVHFSLDTIDPFSLGFKAVSVNVSDLVSSFSFPKYASIGLSLKEDVSESFVEEFYKGVNHAANVYELIISGGDLTKSDKMRILFVQKRRGGRRWNLRGTPTSRTYSSVLRAKTKRT